MKELKRIVNTIIDLIKDNKNILLRIYEEDKEVCDFEFDIEKLIQILQKYKEKQVNEVNPKKVLIEHYGNPYITAMLCMESLMNHSKITIGIEDVCYGLNKAIIKIVNDTLKEHKVNTQIFLKNNLKKEEIEQMDFERVICLGNSNTYMNFRKIKNVPIEYVPLFDINLYYDSEEYEELVENIRYYAIQNFYEIEIFDETEEFEDVVYMINNSLEKYCSIILSKNKQKQEKFKKQINSKIICINENPFIQFEFKIPSEIFM